jgi:23S rRNA (adenine2030-N6)-methyltransferase
MNYRHAYHAGNFADVLKHAVLVWVVRYLQQKAGPLCLIDTHGGAGLYDLGAEAARKTGEAAGGILRLAATPDLPTVVGPYVDLVRRANGGEPFARYPGSPWLMAQMLRARDRAVVGELHPEDAAGLRAALRGTDRIRIVEGDGYALLDMSVPPPEKRGLVLIDPPFEADDEFETLGRAVITAHGKWPTGVFLVWYPIKDRAAVERFHAELLNARVAKVAAITLDVGETELGLRACGLLLINPPWTLAQEWREPLIWLARILARGENSSARIETLAE